MKVAKLREILTHVSLPDDADVTVRVFDADGELIAIGDDVAAYLDHAHDDKDTPFLAVDLNLSPPRPQRVPGATSRRRRKR